MTQCHPDSRPNADNREMLRRVCHDSLISTSYRECRRMARRAGSNFYASFLLLPKQQRRALEALYAFMRHTDDLADATDAPARRREELAAWRTALEMAVCPAGDFASTALPPASPITSILPALVDAIERFHIPVEHLRAVIDGVEMDLDRRRFETFDELRTYCERVASAVGLACIHIWGFRGHEALEPARQAGIAMQLTNILRDLKEDAAAGRIYLPLADLRTCDYSVDDLTAGVVDQRFHRLMAMEVERAEQFYRQGSELMPLLEPAGRRVFGLMMATYRSLLKRIACHPSDVFQRRVRLSRFTRLRLAARWLLWPPSKDWLR